MAELDDCIDSLLREGKLESSGHFTLDVQKALEKLAAFQLPHPDWWILKFVQAAVASGAPSLRFEFSDRQVRLLFEPLDAWDLDDIERSLLEPRPDANPSLDHLKQGLWNCSFHQAHPFQLEIAGCDSKLVGVRGIQHRVSMKTAQATALTISFRQLSRTSVILSLLNAKERYADLLRVLGERAAWTPIPFSITTHGVPSTFRAIADNGTRRVVLETRGLAIDDLPKLPRPALKEWKIPPSGSDGENAYLTMTYRYKSSIYLRLNYRNDEIRWIQDGVWVDSDPLFGGESRCLTLDIDTSATGLASDASGMKLTQSAERALRCRAIRLAVYEQMRLEKTLSGLSQSNKGKILKNYSAGVLGTASLSGLAFGASGFMLMGMAAAFFGGIVTLPFLLGDWESTVFKGCQQSIPHLRYDADKWKRESGTVD